MLRKLNLTYGSKQILADLRSAYPEREFIVLSPSSSTNDSLQMLDLSEQENIFKSGVTYNVINYHGKPNWHGFFNYSFLTVYPENLELFEARLNRWFNQPLVTGLTAIIVMRKHATGDNNLTILTVWSDALTWQRWKKSDNYFFKDYEQNAYNNLHEANFEFRQHFASSK
ncbi:hypothetical protein [Periweissella beninensis]|uniref:ABM domain-containing protein n=1 Tax=Periweissella beninensis TaxID=504936 RepID=A0ABT0VLW2_9LACO|nr:hypothetical protein [Periweissella beninensis]MBM7544127.1 heme-degrading monooxygenase HmoA [Periweissella beninensis]MCM2437500.1 hypothetical protein [Periweissella beninensis]MCT4396572.1 hypothetical protein [Periweissella beninensis]